MCVTVMGPKNKTLIEPNLLAQNWLLSNSLILVRSTDTSNEFVVELVYLNRFNFELKMLDFLTFQSIFFTQTINYSIPR